MATTSNVVNCQQFLLSCTEKNNLAKQPSLIILHETICMLNKLIILLTINLISIQCIAQNNKGFEKPDYAKIEKVTKDKSSPNYYPKLLKRYLSNDNTLTDDEYSLLYYGYFFQDGYSSYGSASKFSDSLKELFKKPKTTDDDRRNIIRYTKDDMKTSPFSLRDLFRLFNLYQADNDKTNSDLCLYKLEKLAKTISATGDARTDSTGLHVMTVEDEYTIIALLGYEFAGTHKQTANHCDYLTLKKNDDNLDGLYFDVKQIFIRFGNTYSDDKK